MMRAGLCTTSAVIGVCLLSGCGYTTARPFPDGIRTVHVEMLQSREFRRNLEFNLTEALVKRIEMDTPYRLAPAKTADSVLSGEILRVEQRVLGDDFKTGLPREIGATIVMRFRWKDLRSGAILVDRPRFAYTTTYIPPVGESFTKGMIRGIDGLAERIVEQMETQW